MIGLKYFERQALQLKQAGLGMCFSDIVLLLMKQYRESNKIPWMEYKCVYDEWFNKYHN